jgi:AcrR family transcriptional regulator
MRADAQRNYQRILAAAHDVFVERGSDATLEEVARRAEVGTGTLYRHFPSREDLLVAVMQDAFVDLHLRAIELGSSTDPFAAFQEYLTRWLHRSAMYKGIAVEIMNEPLHCDPHWAHSVLTAQEDFQDLLKRAQDAGAIRTDVTDKDIWHLMRGVASCLKDPDVRQNEGRTLFDIVLRGLRP